MTESERIICCFVQYPHLREHVQSIAEELKLSINYPNSLEEIFEKNDHSYSWFVVELDTTDLEVKEQQEKRFRQAFSVPITFLNINPSEEDQKHPIEIRIALPDAPTDFLHNVLRDILISPSSENRSELVKNYGNLSKREKEVLRHIVEGKRNKDIARLLYISKRTVEAHRSHILQKMKVDSFIVLACSHITDLN